jgi:phosphate transport system permease protein
MEHKLSYFRKKGDSYVFAASMGLILSLAMVFWIIYIILLKGLSFFWPRDLVQVQLENGTAYLGELWEEKETVQTGADGKQFPVAQIQLKIGNRDLYGRDFIWINQPEITFREYPPQPVTFERTEYGNFYGFIKSVRLKDRTIDQSSSNLIEQAHQTHDLAWENKEKIAEIETKINKLVSPLSRLKLEKLVIENRSIFLTIVTADEREKQIYLSDIVRFFQPNRMNVLAKSWHYAGKLWEFVADDPRESNTEGGLFPAIFGTVVMVLLMSIAVVPFGVMAAIYLNEYAKQGTVIRFIRLSVNNLAGVPSIVFGVFGLGFFIYIIGGSIDQLFFSNKLPEPTFGTGGILWASFTLALLTLPVVVVATEEGLLAVPRANKEGALALGATRWQMIRKVVLPNAMPGILTGLILAISRGAGEVAPLMITGVVKLAPSLPIDGTFPFLHLDRKFMHLGFHIYDVGFQSPNVEAAKPMVYSTALLLILMVVLLNLIAIYFRNRLRKKFKTSTF